jgi:hypothetical protein
VTFFAMAARRSFNKNTARARADSLVAVSSRQSRGFKKTAKFLAPEFLRGQSFFSA